jgi:hypothetical protein
MSTTLRGSWGDHLAAAGKWIGKEVPEAVGRLAKYTWDHPGEAGTLIGVAALSATGVTEVVVGGVALGMGAVAAYRSVKSAVTTGKDPWGAALDVAGLVPGGMAVVKGVKALGATRDAGRLAGLADDAVRSGAAKAAGYNPHSVKASRLHGLSKQSAAEAHRLESHVRRLNPLGIGIGGASAVRHQLPKIGIDHPPLTAPAGLLMRPPMSLAPAQ